MQRVGIIAEFNPLHYGHKFLLDTAKSKGEVVCAISGNFVQRGDTAICEKRIRTKMALQNGADLVLEIPVVYSMSCAQNFALGGVSALINAGCDTLLFGSEEGNIDSLLKTAEILESGQFKEKLAENLKSGITFAKARQIAAEECGAKKGILEGANNNLGIEYILAAKNLGADLKFETVSRKGAYHDSEKTVNEFASASYIREKLSKNDFETAKNYMPENAFLYLNQENISDISRIERAILATLRTKSIDELKELPDISEGLENRLFSVIKTADSLYSLYNNLKVKRYTQARLRRIVLSAFIGIDNTFFMKKPPYIRVLGFNKTGEKIIKDCKNPNLVVRAGEIAELGEKAIRMFEIENKATDLFNLSTKNIQSSGLEYTAKLVTGGKFDE